MPTAIKFKQTYQVPIPGPSRAAGYQRLSTPSVPRQQRPGHPAKQSSQIPRLAFVS